MENKIITSGKRKTAVARAILTLGSGIIKINEINYKNLQFFNKLKIEEPIKIAEKILGKVNFDIMINVRGGGEKSQIEAARLALAKAILEFSKKQNSNVNSLLSKKLEKTYLEYDRNMLIADVRRKEAYKPGDSKARKNRQTSYR